MNKKDKCFGCIYLIENIQNHKIYIGKTSNKNPYKYIETHFKNALEYNNKRNRKRHFHNAIKKYGVQNFKWRILGYCNSLKELNEAEVETIYFYRSFGADGIHGDDIYGYNRTPGGDGSHGNANPGHKRKGKTYKEIYGYKKATKIKNKQSISCSKSLKGKLKSNKHKEKIGKFRKGKTYEEMYGVKRANKLKKEKSKLFKNKNNNSNRNKKGKTYEEIYGIKRSIEIKKKCSEAISKALLGHFVSDKTRKKQSEARLKFLKNKK